MQIVINEQLKNKLSSEEQEAKQRKAQLNQSNGGSPSAGKNSLTANLIATSTLNRNKERFLRLFSMSNRTTGKTNTTEKSNERSEKTNATTTNKTSNNSSTNNVAKTNATTKSSSNHSKTTASRTAKPNSFVSRNKTTNKANSISTISGNKPVNVSS